MSRVDRRKRHATGVMGRNGTTPIEIKNLEHAIAELTSAREELMRIDAAQLRGLDRVHARVEPIARLVLVRRYIDEIAKGAT